MVEFFAERFNYAVVIILMMTGLYVVFSSSNLVKKLVGLSVFQTSVFLLYISVGKVAGGRPPIVEPPHHGEGEAVTGAAAATAEAGHGAETEALVGAEPSHGAEAAHGADAAHGLAPTAPAPAPAGFGGDIPAPDHMTPDGVLDAVYSNPLPHVLILTAIVVGVATLAVGLALVVRIRETYGGIEEDELHQGDLGAERA